jgi:hypothetical protein
MFYIKNRITIPTRILVYYYYIIRNQIFTLRLRVLYLQYKIVLSIQEIIKNTYAVYNRSSINVGFAELKGKPLNIISSCTVLAQSEYKKRHDIFAKIIHMNLAVKFNLLKDTQPHYIYKTRKLFGK